MAKESGMAWTTCEVDDSGTTARDIKNDVTNLDFATPRGVQDTTGLDKSAHERLLLLADFSCTLSGVFNDASNAIFDVGKTAGSTTVDRTVTLVISGQTLAEECVLTDFPFTRAATGEFTCQLPLQLTGGTFTAWA